MRFTILLALFHFSNVFADYLRSTYNFKEIKFKNDTDLIEFWPHYFPLKPFIVKNVEKDENGDSPPIDFEISYIPFTLDRVIDYGASRFHLLPAVNRHDFNRKDLSFLFNRPALICDYDTVWFDPPYRYYGYWGFIKVAYDELHDVLVTGYAEIPFIRHIDTVFSSGNALDNYYNATIFISNNWFYAFDKYNRFWKMGQIPYLWSQSLPHTFIDSVLALPKNNTYCIFFNNRVQCDPNKPAVSIRKKFVGGGKIKYPIKASFHVPHLMIYVLLGHDNVFRIYNENFVYITSRAFCDFMEFGKFHCCWDPFHRTTTPAANVTTTTPMTPNAWVERDPFGPNAHRITPLTTTAVDEGRGGEDSVEEIRTTTAFDEGSGGEDSFSVVVEETRTTTAFDEGSGGEDSLVGDTHHSQNGTLPFDEGSSGEECNDTIAFEEGSGEASHSNRGNLFFFGEYFF